MDEQADPDYINPDDLRTRERQSAEAVSGRPAVRRVSVPTTMRPPTRCVIRDCRIAR